MSILLEAILESKKLKAEALELAKRTLMEQHKETLDNLAKDLFMKKLNEEKKSDDEDDKKETDTRVKGDEIEDYLDSEIGNNPIEVTVSIEDKDEVKDLSDEKDDKKIEEAFSSLSDDDGVMIVKEKEEPTCSVEKTTNDNLKTEMEQAKKDLNEMENIDNELKDLEVNLKNEDVTSDIVDGGEDLPLDTPTDVADVDPEGGDVTDDQIAEAFNSMSEEEKSQILEGLTQEEMDELAEALVLSLDDDGGEGTAEIVPSEVPTEPKPEGVPTEPEDEKVEEGISGAISFSNAKKQGNSDTSDGKEEHAREYAKKFESIQRTFDKISAQAIKLEEENKRLKNQLSALNESETKLKGQNSEYLSQLTKYKEKCYEALLEAKKAMCVNKLLLENSTTQPEKDAIVEAFASATNLTEIELVNKHLNESLVRGVSVNMLKESTLEHIINKTSVLKTGSAQLVESTTQVNPMLARMAKNIKYMESKK
jgi:hypothetical protein